jgi:hypothetical protein
LKKIVNLSLIAFLAVLSLLLSTYFFEDLPMELAVDNRERGHPDRAAFYKTGILHTLVANVQWNVLHCPESHLPDAATVYRLYGDFRDHETN